MFIRRKTVKGLDYYQVIETYRDAGRVRHRTMVSLGRRATPEEAIRTCRARMKRLRRELEFWSPSRHLVGRYERRCTDIEHRLNKAATHLATLKDVRRLLKAK